MFHETHSIHHIYNYKSFPDSCARGRDYGTQQEISKFGNFIAQVTSIGYNYLGGSLPDFLSNR